MGVTLRGVIPGDRGDTWGDSVTPRLCAGTLRLTSRRGGHCRSWPSGRRIKLSSITQRAELRHTACMTARTVFVISPIGSPGSVEHRRYWLTLEYIVKKAFQDDRWEVVRADEESSPDSITTQVIGRIIEADLIIADLTDHNPNVFYELAVAHGYQKSVIHLMQDGQKVPFDVVDQRVIFYDLADPESVDKARQALKNSVEWLDANPGQSRNPLSAYGQFAAISSATGGGEIGEAVAEALNSLSRQVARMDARQRQSLESRPTSRETNRRSRLSDIELERRLDYIHQKRDSAMQHSENGENVDAELQVLAREEMRLLSLMEERATKSDE